MGRYLKSHLVVGLIYLGLMFVKLLNGGGLDWQWGLSFGLGVIVGVWLLFLDRLVYVYTYPEEQLSQHFIYLWKQGRRGQALALLDARRSEQQRLMFRSILFVVVWIPLAFFSLTSSLSVFGKGVVMGIMWHILWDSWRLQRINPEKLNYRLFWQIKRKFSREEQMAVLGSLSLIFLLLSWWV